MGFHYHLAWKEKKKMLCSWIDRAKWLCITDPSGRNISLDALSNSKKIDEHQPDTINDHFSSPDYNIFLWGNLSNYIELACENLLQEFFSKGTKEQTSGVTVDVCHVAPFTLPCTSPCWTVCPCAQGAPLSPVWSVEAGERHLREAPCTDICAKGWTSSAETS